MSGGCHMPQDLDKATVFRVTVDYLQFLRKHVAPPVRCLSCRAILKINPSQQLTQMDAMFAAELARKPLYLNDFAHVDGAEVAPPPAHAHRSPIAEFRRALMRAFALFVHLNHLGGYKLDSSYDMFSMACECDGRGRSAHTYLAGQGNGIQAAGRRAGDDVAQQRAHHPESVKDSERIKSAPTPPSCRRWPCGSATGGSTPHPPAHQ